MQTYTQWINEKRVIDDTTLDPIFDILNNKSFKTEYTSNKSMDALDISASIEKLIDKNDVNIKDDSHFNYVVDVLSDIRTKNLFKSLVGSGNDILQNIPGAVKKMTEFIKANFKL